MNVVTSKKIIPIVLIFFFINALLFITKSFLQLHGFHFNFLLAGNALLFLLSVTGFLLQAKSIHSPSTNVFLRGIYTSLLIKMFTVIIAAGVYLFIAHGKINLPSLLALMGLYIVYTTIEVKQMLKLYRPKSNA